MYNRYFSLLDKFRNNKGNWLSRKIEYKKTIDFLNKFSPSVGELEEIIRFVKILETSLFYPNKRDTVYFKDKDKSYVCPIIVEVLDNYRFSMSIPGNPITNIDKNRYNVKINITVYTVNGFRPDNPDGVIEIIVYDEDNKKKPVSTIRFKNGNYTIKEAYEEHLFITIIDNISLTIKQLLEVYCLKLK